MTRAPRVLGGKNGLRVDGRGQIFRGETESEFIAALDVIGPASLASLRQALLRATARGRHHFAQVYLVNERPSKVQQNPGRYSPEPVEIWLDEGLGLRDEGLKIFTATYGDPEDGLPDTNEISALVEPYVTRHGATAEVGVNDDEYDFGGYYQLGIWISFPLARRTVRDGYELGRGLLSLLEAAEGGGLRYATTLDLLRSGRVDLLIGQSESHWIDFKRQPYKRDEHDRLELAKDVAAFANSEGGLIVLGMATRKTGHTEVASKVTPCPSGQVSVQSLRATVARRVYPSPEGIEIFSIPRHPGDVWIISIPPQPDEAKPFLVHGAVIDRKVNDAYVSLVSRRDDASVPLTPQAMHALIATGRAAPRVPQTTRRPWHRAP